MQATAIDNFKNMCVRVRKSLFKKRDFHKIKKFIK